MHEQPTTPERLPIEGAEVLAALKANGIEQTNELVGEWINQIRAEREKNQSIQEHKEEIYETMIETSIATGLLYRDAGMYQEAWDELEETGYIALNAGRQDICERIHKLLDEIEEIPRE